MQNHGPAQPPLPLSRGPNFTYVLPPGWAVGEEGQFALVLRSPDMMASIIVFGQSGLMQPMSPDQFAYYCMANVMRLAPALTISDADFDSGLDIVIDLIASL